DVGPVLCLEPQAEDVWFGWSAINGLGRARLHRFTADLVPGFASDLVTSDAGEVTSACTVNGRRYFAVSGEGFYGETTTLRSTGTVDLGYFTFGIAEPKVVDTVTLWTDALPSGCSVVVTVYPDDSSTPLLTLTHSTAGAKK